MAVRSRELAETEARILTKVDQRQWKRKASNRAVTFQPFQPLTKTSLQNQPPVMADQQGHPSHPASRRPKKNGLVCWGRFLFLVWRWRWLVWGASNLFGRMQARARFFSLLSCWGFLSFLVRKPPRNYDPMVKRFHLHAWHVEGFEHMACSLDPLVIESLRRSIPRNTPLKNKWKGHEISLSSTTPTMLQSVKGGNVGESRMRSAGPDGVFQPNAE